MKNQKGITLVALVITIIVMLILVAVSITIAINGNLFGITKEAAKGTQNAINEENNLASGQATINGAVVNIDSFSNLDFTVPEA